MWETGARSVVLSRPEVLLYIYDASTFNIVYSSSPKLTIMPASKFVTLNTGAEMPTVGLGTQFFQITTCG